MAQLRSKILEEPRVVFGSQGQHIDPKLGLCCFGPVGYDETQPPLPSTISLGFVGSGHTLGLLEKFIDDLRRPIPGKSENPFLFPRFPGFHEEAPFCCKLVTHKDWRMTIPNRQLDLVMSAGTGWSRVARAADLIVKQVQAFEGMTPGPQVIICALPTDFVKTCAVAHGPLPSAKKGTRVSREKQEEGEKAPRLPFFDELEEGNKNLRRAVKARLMQSGAATQIVLEKTLIGEGGQDPATVAWNLAVGLYHKANGRPWRLRDADPGSCFVGVRFYQEKATLGTNLRTSLAQIFSHRGEGIILRGSRFAWENPDLPRTPHLSEDAAAELARQIVEAYQNAEKSIPRRVVVHKSSRYWDEELEGFRKGFGEAGVTLVDLVTIGQRGIRVVRTGDYPVIRGTMLSITQSNFILYTRGYIPYFGTYPGAHVPNPLEVLECLGDASDLDIAREVLALTKLNWNTADFSSGFPITLEFADRVAQVLSELDDEKITPNEKYRYYM